MRIKAHTHMTVWCDSCQRYEAVPTTGAEWRALWINRNRQLTVANINVPGGVIVSREDDPPFPVSMACGDEGASKLLSRWLNTGSLDAPRGNVAEPVVAFAPTEGA